MGEIIFFTTGYNGFAIYHVQRKGEKKDLVFGNRGEIKKYLDEFFPVVSKKFSVYQNDRIAIPEELKGLDSNLRIALVEVF